MRLISEDATKECLSLGEAARIVTESYRGHGLGRVELSNPSSLRVTREPHHIGAKGAALLDADIAGLRLMSRADPRTLIWSLSTGLPVAFIEEKWLYRFRTGVSAAVAADLIRPGRKGETIAVIGAGPIGREAVQAIASRLVPAEIRVASRRPESSQLLAAEAETAGVPIHACESVEAAVADADLIVTITSATSAFLSSGMLHESATVLSMGGGAEVDHDVWTSAAGRYVDDLEYASGRGDAAAWIAAGAYDLDGFTRSLTGTIGDLAAGRGDAPRTGRVMAIVQGLTALDIALAHAVVVATSETAA